MSARQITIWAIVAIALYFVIAAPEQAATLVRNTVESLRIAAESLIQFLQRLGR